MIFKPNNKVSSLNLKQQVKVVQGHQLYRDVVSLVLWSLGFTRRARSSFEVKKMC